jgi:TPR repeat protein
MMGLAANDSVDALMLAAIQAFERGDSDSLAYAVLRAGELGMENPGQILGTTLVHLEKVSPKVGHRVLALIKEETESNNSALSHYALAAIYSAGALGLPQDNHAAYEHLVRADQFGMKEASIFLGSFAYQGIGCDRDEHAAIHWFNKAAKAGFLFGKSQALKLDSSIGAIRRLFGLIKLSVQVFSIAIRNPKDPRLTFLSPRACLFVDDASNSA